MAEAADTRTEAPEEKEPSLPMSIDDPIAFAEVLIDHVELRKFYKERNVHCFGCGAAEAETFREGAEVHAGGPFGRFDPQKLVDELNELGKKHPYSKETHIELSLTRSLLEWIFPSKES
jgi:hypothetical protein